MNVYLEILMSMLLGATAVALIFARDLFGLTVLLSVYSGLLAVTFALLGAVDVAFTEAVVGAGVSTGLIVALLRQVRAEVRAEPHGTSIPGMERATPGRRTLAVLTALGLAAVMLHGAHALPTFGDPDSPAHRHLSAQYIQRSEHDTHTPNVVTAVLADYRGFDTLIETSVVLTGALACLLILRRHRGAAPLSP